MTRHHKTIGGVGNEALHFISNPVSGLSDVKIATESCTFSTIADVMCQIAEDACTDIVKR